MAVVSFYAGRGRYKHSVPKESPISRAVKIIWTALSTSTPSSAPGEVPPVINDWLDRASLRGRFSRTQINEVTHTTLASHTRS